MIKQIQNEYTPDVVTPPGDTLQEVIDTTGMTKSELADRIGKTPKFINDIINHYAAITPTTAMELEKVLGTPASFWNNRERRYRESIAHRNERKRLQQEIKWLDAFPTSLMVKVGWIEKHKNKIDQVEALLRFSESPLQQDGKTYGFRRRPFIASQTPLPLNRKPARCG